MSNPNYILIVDDDPDIHNFIQHDLSESPFEVISAYTVEEAIKELGNYHFTFALVDIVLGEGSSSEKLLHFLSQDLAGRNQFLPMAVMSAHMNEDYGKKVRVKGSSVFATLKKPLKPNHLRSIVEGKASPSVLIIDDDPDIIHLIKSELEKGHFQVFATRNVFHAINLVKVTDFVGAIVDNKLGVERDSMEFINFLLSQNDYKIPLILTGTEVNNSLKKSKELLVFDSVKKPFKRGSFLKIFTELKIFKENNDLSLLEGAIDLSDSNTIKGVTDKLSDENQYVRGLEESLGEDSETIAGKKEDLAEKSSIVKGQKEDLLEESTLVKGKKNYLKEEEFIVKGDNSLAEENTLIKGRREELAEENLLIKGEQGQATDEKWVVKSLDGDGKEPIEIGFDMKATSRDPNQRNNQGITPLMAYCYTGQLDKVRDLVLDGGKLDLKARNGKGCLHFAAYSKNQELVRYLTEEHSLKVNDRDESGHEPLYEALKTGDCDMARLLLSKGARLRTKYDGRNYLILAVLKKNKQMVEVFIDQGISPDEKDYSGKSAFDYAMKLGVREITELLRRK